MKFATRKARRSRGFTLTELAVVLVIVALLIGGLLMPLGAQDEARRTAETQRTLNDIREALVGFAVTNERLPCPASATSHGLEEQVLGDCDAITAKNATMGFVPAATLGTTPTDNAGFAIDAWGNRIRYAVTTAKLGANDFTKPGGIRAYYTANANTPPPADLRVCASAPEQAALQANSCAIPETTNVLTKTAVAVVFSVGKNAGDNGGTDESVNQGDRPVFVYHVPAPAGSVNGEFDDIVIWLSPYILYNKMIAAGRLP